VLEIIRPLDKDEARVSEAFRLALPLSAVASGFGARQTAAHAGGTENAPPTRWTRFCQDLVVFTGISDIEAFDYRPAAAGRARCLSADWVSLNGARLVAR
jgi:hypothetical protein